jgi:N-acetylglucosaminyl-diphospho-decaprenol L-rhamnosyltransferase
MLLRPDAVRSVGGFDPSFFLYAEDVDLGRRLQEAGWRSWIVPDATAHHSVAASSGGITDRWLVALHDYNARTASRTGVIAFDLIAGLGLGVRALAARHDPVHRKRMAVAARAAFRLALGRGSRPSGTR